MCFARILLLLGAALVALMLGAQIGHVATAYGQTPGPGDMGFGHHENHDWYREMKQPGTNMSCCNGDSPDNPGDCRITFAHIDDQGRWHALLDGRWVIVPQRSVMPKGSNKQPFSASICASATGVIYCFFEKDTGG